jgi:hypothetical protein
MMIQKKRMNNHPPFYLFLMENSSNQPFFLDTSYALFFYYTKS